MILHETDTTDLKFSHEIEISLAHFRSDFPLLIIVFILQETVKY